VLDRSIAECRIDRCQWQLHHAPKLEDREQKVVEILNFFKIANADIEPGGHDWPAIERSIHSNQRVFAGIGPKMMCVKANAMYGPKGAVSPGLMEPK